MEAPYYDLDLRFKVKCPLARIKNNDNVVLRLSSWNDVWLS